MSTYLPLHELPSLFLQCRIGAGQHDDSGRGRNGDVVDLTGLRIYLTGQRVEAPTTFDLGCEDLELVVCTYVRSDTDRHFTGTETVGEVVGVGEAVHGEHVTHLLERGQSHVGVEVDSHTVISEELTAHLIQEDLILGVHTDLHVVRLQDRDCCQNIVPSSRDFDIQLCQNVLTNEHHIEVLSLGQTVYMVLTGGVLNTENHHCCLIEVLSNLIEAFQLIDVVQRTADRVVDNIALTQTDIQVGTHAGKNGGKQSGTCDQLQINGDAGLRSKVIVDQASNNLRLVTTVSQPNLNGLFIGSFYQRAHVVVVTEEGPEEGDALVCESLEEAGSCLGSSGISGLNGDVVQLERLSLSIAEPSTQGTDIGLQLLHVCSNLILITTHLLEQPGDLIQSCGLRGLVTGNGNQLLRNFIENERLLNHVVQRIGHNAGETVVTVFIGVCTGQLQDLQVVIVDGIESCVNTSDDVTHRAESDFELDRVNNILLEVEQQGLIRIGYQSRLPTVIVCESERSSLGIGNTVIVTLSTLCQAFAVDVKSTGGVHTVEHVLSEARADRIHTGLVYLKGVGRPLACGLPLFTADGVEQLVCRVGRATCCRGTVLNGIDGLCRCILCRLGLDLDIIGTVCSACICSKIILVGVERLMRNQADALDRDGLVLRFERNGILACVENDVEILCIEAVRILYIIERPNRSLLHGVTKLVTLDIVGEETDEIFIYKCGVFIGPILGHFENNIGTVFTSFCGCGDAGCSCRADIAICALTAAQQDLAVGIGVGIDLRKGQVTRLCKGDLAIQSEYTLDGCRFSFDRIIFDQHAVLSLSRNLDLPNSRSYAGGVQGLNAVKSVNLNIGGCQFLVVLGCVDHDFTRGAGHIFILCAVLLVRNRTELFLNIAD